MTIEHTRRQFLRTSAGLAAIGGFAGCIGSDDDALAAVAGEGLSARASFFVVGDFARQVAGDAASVETVVPIGQHGHGWEPGPDVQREVLTADAFVYVMDGFQPWADDVIANATSDDAGVAMIESAAGIELLSADGHEHGHTGRNDDGQHESRHDDHGHENESEHGHTGENESEGSHEHEHDARNAHEQESDHGDEHAENESEHAHEGEDGHEEGHDDSHGHEHGETDPHFWLDPQRAKQAVETIRRGLTDADPGDNGGAYAENADAYGRRIDELDAAFASALEDAPGEHVLVAGHDAFQYLGARYGFEVHALTGLAPDDTPTPQDISEAQSIVEEHGIEYVLAPQLESKRAATQLVAETSAREVLEVTPIPGTAEEWEENGWGYVEIMENVNLPAFRRALGAE